MPRAWENNPNGICEDAPCCGCCGPNGDGAFDPDEPPDDSYEDSLNEYDEDYDEGGEHILIGESPDPNWMND